MRLSAILPILFLVLAGCAENVDPNDPEGAYSLYVKALWAQDAEGVWERAAPSTHEYFQQRYETLVAMDETIVRYLPPTDHKIAREQAGSILTDKVNDGKGLFLEVFKPTKLTLAEKHEVGATVDQIRINEDETAAELTTLGGDVFYLTKADDEEWYVMLVRSSEAVEKQMGWLTSNEEALNQTIEDLIAEEREEREAVIQELMNLQDPDGSSDEGDEPSEDTEDEAADGDDDAAGAEGEEDSAAAADDAAPTEDG